MSSVFPSPYMAGKSAAVRVCNSIDHLDCVTYSSRPFLCTLGQSVIAVVEDWERG